MLLILTVIGVGAMRSSLFELQMSRNEESRMSTFQRAQSLVDATVGNTSNTVVSGQVGDVICMQKDANVTWNGMTCGQGTLHVIDDLITAPHDQRSTVFVKRLAPDFVPAPRGLGFSVDFDAAQFEVSAMYDASSAKLGRSSLAQGVMVIVKAAQ
jgi:Tfp pilus assembly protein PilX